MTMRMTHDWTPCLSYRGLEFLHWLPSRPLYASLLRGFSHYRHVCGGLFLPVARRGYQSLGTLYPVSYTHLDVYKRQVLVATLVGCSVGVMCDGRQ